MQKTFLKILSATTVTMTATVLVAHAQDGDVDFKTEERFHRVYKAYNEQPTSGEAWEKVLSNRKANSYSVQEKDTLWDISNTLFGEAHYWPKVWSYNTDDILNPHQINPKQMIKFYPGTMAEAPTVGLADKGSAPEELPTHVLEKKEDGSLESVKIPPPKRKSRPLVKHLPNSLPLYRLGGVNRPPLDFEISGAKVKYTPAPKNLSFYVLDIAPTATGEVVELERLDEATTGEYQMVIVRVSNAGNKNYVAFTDSHTVADPFDSGANKGTVVEVQGEIEVMERVNESENLFRAMVKRAINPLEVGAKLMPGKIENFDSGPTAVTTSVQTRIIGGEYQKFNQKMFGADNIVFLNAGAKEGLQAGSTLQVYMNERLRKPKTKAVENDRVIGTVKIIKLSDHFATGYVLDSSADLMIGDYAGGRATAAPKASSASASETEAFDVPSDHGGNNSNSDPDFDLDSPTPIDDGGGAPAPADPEDDFQL